MADRPASHLLPPLELDPLAPPIADLSSLPNLPPSRHPPPTAGADDLPLPAPPQAGEGADLCFYFSNSTNAGRRRSPSTGFRGPWESPPWRALFESTTTSTGTCGR
jgi:hypothetical protein